MMITKLQGGLGNQMFQYAAARACSPVNPVVADLSFLQDHAISTAAFTSRKYRLGVFDRISIRFLNSFERKLIGGSGFGYRLLKKLILPDLRTLHDHTADHDRKTTGPLYLDGYFQNEAYFKGIRSLLLHEFSFPPLREKPAQMGMAIRACGTSVALHVRRGDYLKPQIGAYHGVLPLSYYRDAVAHISRINGDAQYFVFSDDMPWCRENFAFLKDKVTFADPGQEDWTDMALMSHCDHQIIANSSFSWWAAWLNRAAEKVIIAPNNWFADIDASNTSTNIIPNSWIRI